MKRNVLFICSANMCRSPMAEGYLKKRALEKGLDELDVRSAAVFFNEDYQATSGARETARKNGFSLDHHRSQFMDNQLFEWADDILVMTKEHRNSIISYYQEPALEKVSLLGEYDPRYVTGDIHASPEIDDPYGGSNVTYEIVFDTIKRSIDAWLDQLLESHND